jgi:rhodanese-related sulfurtransferase
MRKYSLQLAAAVLISLFICALFTQAGQDDAEAVKNIDSGEAHVLIEKNKENPDFVILDVRTDKEYSKGHLKDSANIDYKSETFVEEMGKLDKSKTYVVYCRSGRRSAAAADIMKEAGFVDVYMLEGGIVGWQSDGFPVEK